jgi:hypothetical protein
MCGGWLSVNQQYKLRKRNMLSAELVYSNYYCTLPKALNTHVCHHHLKASVVAIAIDSIVVGMVLLFHALSLLVYRHKVAHG